MASLQPTTFFSALVTAETSYSASTAGTPLARAFPRLSTFSTTFMYPECRSLWRRQSTHFQSSFLESSMSSFLSHLSRVYKGMVHEPIRAQKELYRCMEVDQLGNDIDEQIDTFSGLGPSEFPLGTCQTRTLDPVLFIQDALLALEAAVTDYSKHRPPLSSGIIRIQVPLPPDIKALQWLQAQTKISCLPKIYFSVRAPRGDGKEDQNDSNGVNPGVQDVDACGFCAVAGVGAAVLFHDSKPFSKAHWTAIQRFLSKGSPEIKVYGAMRFNPEQEPAEEWRLFGSFYFLIPQVELCEGEGCSMLAVSIAWDTSSHWSFDESVKLVSETLSQISSHVGSPGGQRTLQVDHKEHVPDERLWHEAVNSTLQKIGEAEDSTILNDWQLDPSCFDELGLSKVVMARRTKLWLPEDVDALMLLASLQEKDPSAYQFCIQLPSGASFIGSTPERLFARKGLRVASEAVAATRPRGHTSSNDLDTSIDLILSTKDHNEFEIVRESIKRNLERVCKHVKVESHKSIIKQARIQHLYGRFVGELHNEAGEFDLLAVLHPTPAVCGHPQGPAREAITAIESFDRGMYAGPVGWFGGNGAEFAVGIRSSLVQPISHIGSVGADEAHKGSNIYLYAGVGVVKSSDSLSEWRELELKVSQFEALLQPSSTPENIVNINVLWAKLIIEECCRLGITYFCIAPGSRSSPLTSAAAANPRARCLSCIDERSLAFHAIGYGRGAGKPAAVITSSGTAVSNLLPAVVEASQDCVPLLVLTADRPHELRDTSANQTIDQVKHFGGYVRHHFDLPPADDKIPARMVLTTLDSAVFRAKSAPSGPVHINCPFREPLAGLVEPWSSDCLKGLDRWFSSLCPFTIHINGNDNSGHLGNILGLVNELKEAKRGLLVVGGLHTREETWAVAMLASQLGWPVIPDVLSGLRIGDTFTTDMKKEQPLRVIHHFDQILLSKQATDALSPDVILQIGGRLTSTRIGNFLEAVNPKAYILVEEHPFRADPSHVLTHRIQAGTNDFVAALLRIIPKATLDHTYFNMLQMLSEAVGREIKLKLSMGTSITEPYVACLVAASTPPGSTLFLGNSMPIRDVEMYATGSLDQGSSKEFVGLTRRVASNRGASGIDGVLSTAIGFAAGSSRRVTLLVGDVSFLHDTNGLTLLKERAGQPPVTVVVVNNGGGGIFSLLPIAKTIPVASFTTLWSTQHDVDILKLCRAHRVNHIGVRTKDELQSALEWVGRSPKNWVVEVESNIEHNTEFHQFLQTSVMQATNRAFQVFSMFTSVHGQGSNNQLAISGAELFHYKIPLSTPLTTSVRRGITEGSWREGFFLCITLGSTVSGVGEVAPLEGLHTESLEDVKGQLQLLLPMLKGLILPSALALLNGSFSAWLFDTLGVQAKTLYPSVRCGLEMAALEALAAAIKCTLSELLLGCESSAGRSEISVESMKEKKVVSSTQICALLESEGTPEQIADAAGSLVSQGFSTLKVKVGRHKTPQEDAAVMQAIRERVGANVHLRADANRKWTYKQAVEFADLVRLCGLQYLEEPVELPQDIPRFCKETRMPVALDESIDEDVSTSNEMLQSLVSHGVVAAVIKPGRVGGFERAVAISEWAQRQGMVAVISSAFESSVGLSAYAHLAAHVDKRGSELRRMPSSQALQISTVAHGLGTYMWLGGDVIQSRQFVVERENGAMVAPLGETTDLRHKHHFNDMFVTSMSVGDVESHLVKITSGNKVFELRVWDTQGVTPIMDDTSPTLLFLHGFLGTGHEWLPIIRPLSSSFRCIAIDLPGHGHSVQENGALGPNMVSMESISDVLLKLLDKLGTKAFVPIGYSMGARIALYLALRHSERISGMVSISGSPGLEDECSREVRRAQDLLLAESIKEQGLEAFMDAWYQQPFWESLRQHPTFDRIRKERAKHKDAQSLANVLASLSVGQQPSLWEELRGCSSPALLVAGSLDTKFVSIARKICERAGQRPQKSHRSQKTSRARQKEVWESQEFRLPFDFLKEFPEINMVLPSLDSVPKDDGFAAFFDQEMKKLQLEDMLALGTEDWPAGEDHLSPEWEADDAKKRHEMFQVAEVEDCGHAVHVENPWVFLRLLQKFLRQLEGS